MLRKLLYMFLISSIVISAKIDPAKEYQKIISQKNKFKISLDQIKRLIESYQEELSQEWEDNVWVNDYFVKMEFDEVNLISTMYQYEPDSTTTWAYKSKNVSKYSIVEGYLFPTEEITYNFEDTTWVQSFRVEFAYDVNHCPIQFKAYLNLGGMELLYGQTDITYNSAFQPVLSITQLVNFQTMQLGLSAKTEYTYNPNDLKDCQVEINSDYENGAWVKKEKYSYTRNSVYEPLTETLDLYITPDQLQRRSYSVYEYLNDSLVTSEDRTMWDEETGIYANRTLELISYDTNMNIVSELYKDSSDIANVWNENAKNTYTYDSQNRMLKALTEYATFSGWENNNQKIYYYTPTTDVEDEIINVNNYSLSNNYPNPFNPSTTIKFNIPTEGFVTLKVYDMLGREVVTLVNENKSVGEYSYNFNAANLASGMYIYQLKVNNFISSKKMLLIK